MALLTFTYTCLAEICHEELMKLFLKLSSTHSLIIIIYRVQLVFYATGYRWAE